MASESEGRVDGQGADKDKAETRFQDAREFDALIDSAYQRGEAEVEDIVTNRVKTSWVEVSDTEEAALIEESRFPGHGPMAPDGGGSGERDITGAIFTRPKGESELFVKLLARVSNTRGYTEPSQEGSPADSTLPIEPGEEKYDRIKDVLGAMQARVEATEVKRDPRYAGSPVRSVDSK